VNERIASHYSCELANAAENALQRSGPYYRTEKTAVVQAIRVLKGRFASISFPRHRAYEANAWRLEGVLSVAVVAHHQQLQRQLALFRSPGGMQIQPDIRVL
jgi:hypothetical protein